MSWSPTTPTRPRSTRCSRSISSERSHRLAAAGRVAAALEDVSRDAADPTRPRLVAAQRAVLRSGYPDRLLLAVQRAVPDTAEHLGDSAAGCGRRHHRRAGCHADPGWLCRLVRRLDRG